MTADDISGRLLSFLRQEFLDGDPGCELQPGSPLLEWGVLTSMNTMLMLNFIQTEFGVAVPPAALSARNLRDVRSITALIADLADTAGMRSSLARTGAQTDEG
jgi:clorobiocin biosynthesis protein CloN5